MRFRLYAESWASASRRATVSGQHWSRRLPVVGREPSSVLVAPFTLEVNSAPHGLRHFRRQSRCWTRVPQLRRGPLRDAAQSPRNRRLPAVYFAARRLLLQSSAPGANERDRDTMPTEANENEAIPGSERERRLADIDDQSDRPTQPSPGWVAGTPSYSDWDD